MGMHRNQKSEIREHSTPGMGKYRNQESESTEIREQTTESEIRSPRPHEWCAPHFHNIGDARVCSADEQVDFSVCGAQRGRVVQGFRTDSVYEGMVELDEGQLLDIIALSEESFRADCDGSGQESDVSLSTSSEYGASWRDSPDDAVAFKQFMDRKQLAGNNSDCNQLLARPKGERHVQTPVPKCESEHGWRVDDYGTPRQGSSNNWSFHSVPSSLSYGRRSVAVTQVAQVGHQSVPITRRGRGFQQKNSGCSQTNRIGTEESSTGWSTAYGSTGFPNCNDPRILQTLQRKNVDEVHAPWSGPTGTCDDSRRSDQRVDTCDVLQVLDLHNRWPGKKTKASVQFELPLHLKNPPMISLEKLRSFMNEETSFWFEKSYAYFDAHAKLPLLTSQSSRCLLSKADIKALLGANLIRPIPEQDVCGWVSTFSVEEKGIRRRWIVHPRQFNNNFPADILPSHLALGDVGDVISESSGYLFATVADFASYYHQFPVHASTQKYFCFMFEGSAYACKTICTGATVCPNVGQLASITVAKEAIRRSGVREVVVHVVIDNIRFLTKTEREAQNIASHFVNICQESSITINKDELFVAVTTYDFLGCKFEHGERSGLYVSLAERFIKKLPLTHGLQHVTLRAVLKLFGKLIYGFRVLALPLAKYYYIYKFMRRRVNCLLDAPANVWPSIFI